MIFQLVHLSSPISVVSGCCFSAYVETTVERYVTVDENGAEVNCRSQLAYYSIAGLLCFLSFVINVLYICCFTAKEEITAEITVGEKKRNVNCRSHVVYFPAGGLLCLLSFVIKLFFSFVASLQNRK